VGACSTHGRSFVQNFDWEASREGILPPSNPMHTVLNHADICYLDTQFYGAFQMK
jgi:hypothetical protein